MMFGHFRDGFPRIMLTLPGHSGPINIEFILDTAFDGELAVPGHVLTQLQVGFQMDKRFRFADGTEAYQPTYEILLEWDGQARLTEVIQLENAPLLGVQLMNGKFLQAEMTDGGEVSLDDL